VVSERLDRFIPREKGSSTHCIGGCVGPQPIWKLWRRDKSHVSCREPNQNSWSSSPYLSHYTAYTALAGN